jgi:hypothetical protein
MSAKQDAGDRSTGKRRGTPRPGCGGAREGAGRKPFVPTEEQLEKAWAGLAVGMSEADIRLCILHPKTNRPIDRETFRKYFRETSDAARASLKLEIAHGLVKDMRAGVANSTRIFLSKTLLGLREVVRNEFDPNSPLVVRWESGK